MTIHYREKLVFSGIKKSQFAIFSLAFLALFILSSCDSDNNSGSHWLSATPISTDATAYNFGPKLAIDSNDDAIVIWMKRRFDIDQFNLVSRRFSAGTGWGSEEIIVASYPNWYDVITDLNGNAMVFWQFRDSNGTGQLWAKYYSSDLGWRNAVQINAQGTDASSAHIAFDPNGIATAMWTQSDNSSSSNDVWCRHYDPVNEWGVAELFVSNTSVSALAFAENGVGIFVGATSYSADPILVKVLDPDIGWGPEVIVNSFAPTGFLLRSGTPLSINSEGRAILIWQQGFNVWASPFTPSTGWGAPEQIQNETATEFSFPRTAIDERGNGIAMWSIFWGLENNLWVNHFDAATGWNGEFLIPTNGQPVASFDMALHPNGNAITIWNLRNESSSSLWSNVYTSDVGWSQSENIANAPESFIDYPCVELFADGNAISIWAQNNHIWANYYYPP